MSVSLIYLNFRRARRETRPCSASTLMTTIPVAPDHFAAAESRFQQEKQRPHNQACKIWLEVAHHIKAEEITYFQFS